METDQPLRHNKAEYREELKRARQKAAKPLLYIGMVSIVMLFAGLTSAYVVRADSGKWLLFQLPDVAILSTAILVGSSITMLIAQRAIRQNNFSRTTMGLLLTFVLGIAFVFTQWQGWKELTAQGIFFVGKYSNASGSFLYLIALVHLAHLVGGLIALAVSLYKSLRKRYTAEDSLGLELTAIYWHFLDLLWVYLFLFLYFYR